MTASARGWGWGKTKLDALRSPLSALVLALALALADVLEKNEKKNKTTSVKRLRFFNRTQLDFSIPHFTVSKFLKIIAKPNSRKQEELTG